MNNRFAAGNRWRYFAPKTGEARFDLVIIGSGGVELVRCKLESRCDDDSYNGLTGTYSHDDLITHAEWVE